MRLIGFAAILFGLGLAGSMLMIDSGELQALFGLFALAGLLIVLAGGALMAVDAFLERKKAKPTVAPLTPEQQQLLDAQEFQASRGDETTGQ